MTRQDLVNKSIDKLNTVKEALELIEILEYDECIAVLTGTKNLPSEIHSALMRRGKEANGGKTTLALAMAGIQNIVNELKPKRGNSRPVSVRMATDTLTMASRKTSCSDTVGNMAAVAPARKCVDGQQVFDDF